MDVAEIDPRDVEIARLRAILADEAEHVTAVAGKIVSSRCTTDGVRVDWQQWASSAQDYAMWLRASARRLRSAAQPPRTQDEVRAMAVLAYRTERETMRHPMPERRQALPDENTPEAQQKIDQLFEILWSAFGEKANHG